MRVGQFTLTGGLEGKTVELNNRQFENGVLIVSENEARQLEPIFARFYEAKLEFVELRQEEAAKPADPAASLAKAATQPAK